MNLVTLPPDHPLRNRPLAEIGARFRTAHMKQLGLPFANVADTVALFYSRTYNALHHNWKRDTEWEALEYTTN